MMTTCLITLFTIVITTESQYERDCSALSFTSKCSHLKIMHSFLDIPVVVLEGSLALLYCHTMNCLLHLNHTASTVLVSAASNDTHIPQYCQRLLYLRSTRRHDWVVFGDEIIRINLAFISDNEVRIFYLKRFFFFFCCFWPSTKLYCLLSASPGKADRNPSAEI